MNAKTPGKRYVHQGLSIIHMSTPALNQSPRNIKSLRGREMESLRRKSSSTGVDVDAAGTENENVGDSWVINQGCQ
jgi:hypothetical protein